MGLPAYPMEHWEAVADVYNDAIQSFKGPNVAIANKWGVPITTASRWTRVCRELELIPPTVDSKVQERPCNGRCSHCCPKTADR